MKKPKSEKNKKYRVVWTDTNGNIKFCQNLSVTLARMVIKYLHKHKIYDIEVKRDWSNEDN